MPVTVDRHPLAAEELGLSTVGQVLTHLQRDNRLVVHMLIDGEEPDMAGLGAAKRVPLMGHTLYIETADPRELATDALGQVEEQLREADGMKNEAADLLQKNQTVRAMEKLSGCFAIWQNAQETVAKVSELLRIDPAKILVAGRPLEEMLSGFGDLLRQIKTTLEHRDFVSLCDILTYETAETTAQWRLALDGLKSLVENLH